MADPRPWELYQAPDVNTAPETSAPTDQPWTQYETPKPTMGQVAGRAAAMGVAGSVDQLLNAPVNVWNLSKMAYGMAAYKLGHHDIGDAISLTDTPNFASKAVASATEQYAPQTGGQRIVDTAVQTGASLAIPGGGGARKVATDLAKGVALGTATGAAAGAVQEFTGSPVASIATAVLTPIALRRVWSGVGRMMPGARREQVGALLQEGIKKGYTIPPGDIRNSFLMNRVSSMGGRAALDQQALASNQQITNKLAAVELRLPPNAPIRESTLAAIREQFGAVKDEARALSPKAAALVTDIDEARRMSSLKWIEYNNGKITEVKDNAETWGKLATQASNELENIATAAGKADLVPRLKEMRTMTAKTYDIQEALIRGNLNVDATALRNMADNGRPLTGNLALIANWAASFPRVMREASSAANPNIQAFDPLMSAALIGAGGTAGYMSKGDTGAVVGAIAGAAAIPALRGPARAAMLSRSMQSGIAEGAPSFASSVGRGLLTGRATAAIEEE